MQLRRRTCSSLMVCERTILVFVVEVLLFVVCEQFNCLFYVETWTFVPWLRTLTSLVIRIRRHRRYVVGATEYIISN